jgi:uncharacterized membrane protein
MTTLKTFRVVAVLISLLMFTSVVLAQPPPRLATIDYPGASDTFAYGINPAGDIVGGYFDTFGQEHGFVLRNGRFTSFEWPGATWTEGWGINPQGDIVGLYGWFENGFNTIRGFLLRDGNLYPIDVPDQPNTMPIKISPEGTIVGCYHVGTPGGGTLLDTMYGFVLDAAGVTSHSMNRTMNNGVNASGDVVGFYVSPTTGRAEQSYLIRDGLLTWFQFPGSVVTQAWDISPTGTIVGWHRTSLTGAPPLFHGFVMEKGEMTSFDVPGATQTRAFGVSATGDIVGYYVDSTGYHGFLFSHRGSEE